MSRPRGPRRTRRRGRLADPGRGAPHRPRPVAPHRETCHHVAQIVAAGHRVVITHGNGPQVGFILRRSELASHELHEVPLDSCDADTQGAIGYMIQQSLANEFRRRGMACVAVSRGHPGRGRPGEPRAPPAVEADRLVHGRGDGPRPRGGGRLGGRRGRRPRLAPGGAEPGAARHRRARRDPRPARAAASSSSRWAAAASRWCATRAGDYHGIEAVIDKDLASALLAAELGADQLVISTSVPRVCLDFGKPTQRELATLTLAEARAPSRRRPVRPRQHGPEDRGGLPLRRARRPARRDHLPRPDRARRRRSGRHDPHRLVAAGALPAVVVRPTLVGGSLEASLCHGSTRPRAGAVRGATAGRAPAATG